MLQFFAVRLSELKSDLVNCTRIDINFLAWLKHKIKKNRYRARHHILLFIISDHELN